MNNENTPIRPENENRDENEKAYDFPLPLEEERPEPTPAPNPAPAQKEPPQPEQTGATGYTAQWNSRTGRSETPPRPAQPWGNTQHGAQNPYQNQGYQSAQNQNRVVIGSAPAYQQQQGYQNASFGQAQGYQSAGYQNPSRVTPNQGGFPPPPGGYTPAYGTPAPTPKPRKEKKYATRSSMVIAIVLTVLLSLGCGIGGVFLGLSLAEKEGGSSLITPSGGVNITHYDSEYTAEINTDGTVASVAKKVTPAVVEIYTDTVTYSQYFGQQIQSGAGSGVIITKDGYIITCAHVIDGADKITVRLKDGTEYEAKEVGSDSQTDIAIIKISAKEDLTFVGFGTSDNLVVGQPVIAVGNPLGSLGGTVTTGIISATNREIEIEGQLYNLLQTNAAINSGNSGGGLFDMNGNLIGVVNAKSGGDSIEGLGFAIPSSQAEEIATQLMAYGYVKGRPTIGVSLLNVNSQEVVMNYFQYSRFFTDYGVYIIESEHDSLELGDRIVAIDGTEIADMTDIQKVLSEKEVGETISITVSRLNGRKSELITVEITLRERSAED